MGSSGARYSRYQEADELAALSRALREGTALPTASRKTSRVDRDSQACPHSAGYAPAIAM
jgi:hypothetical protein